MVETFGGEVSPYASVFAAVHEPFLEAFEHFGLSFEICLAFVVDLVEVDAHGAVCLVETGIYPAVHLLPEGAHFGIAGLPFAQHLAGLEHQRRLVFGFLFGLSGLDEGFDFVFIVAVEGYVEVADKVVALLARRFGSHSVAPFEPGEHRLADVDSTVIDDVCLDNAVAAGLKNAAEAVAEQNVAQMAEVERLVGVGAGIFDHNQRTVGAGRCHAPVFGRGDMFEHTVPERRLDYYVQESFDGRKAADGRLIVGEPAADLVADSFGSFAGGLDEGEHDDSDVAFESFGDIRELDCGGVDGNSVELADGTGNSPGQYFFY